MKLALTLSIVLLFAALAPQGVQGMGHPDLNGKWVPVGTGLFKKVTTSGQGRIVQYRATNRQGTFELAALIEKRADSLQAAGHENTRYVEILRENARFLRRPPSPLLYIVASASSCSKTLALGSAVSMTLG